MIEPCCLSLVGGILDECADGRRDDACRTLPLPIPLRLLHKVSFVNGRSAYLASMGVRLWAGGSMDHWKGQQALNLSYFADDKEGWNRKQNQLELVGSTSQFHFADCKTVM